MPKGRGGSCVFYQPHFQMLRPTAPPPILFDQSLTSNFVATIAPLSNNMRPQVKNADVSGNTCVLQRVQKVTSVGCTLLLLIFVRLNLKSPAKKGAAKFSDLYKNLYLNFLSARSKRTSRRAKTSVRRMPLGLLWDLKSP